MIPAITMAVEETLGIVIFHAHGHSGQPRLSDDDNHIILQVKSKVPHLPIGSLNLYLKSYRPSTSRPPADTPPS